MKAGMIDAGVIGLGAMGANMARNLHHAGYLGRVWNRTPVRSRALAEETGVTVARSPAGLAQACDVILISVSADDDLLEVIDALVPGLRPGTVVVDTSTVSSDTAREAQSRIARAGGGFLDAPVSGGVEGARQGTLAMMIGGEETLLERVRPVLDAVASRLEYMGLTGAGQATKAVNQIMAAGINQAVSESLAFAEALGLPLQKVIDVVGVGAAGNWFLKHRGSSMVDGVYEPGFRVDLHSKDLGICRTMAGNLAVTLPLVEMTLVHYRRLMDAGYGGEDISALHREKRRLFSKQTGQT